MCRWAKTESVHKKEEVELPTVQLEIIILSLIIDAKEGHDVEIADVVGEYLQANMRDHVLIKLVGNDVKLM